MFVEQAEENKGNIFSSQASGNGQFLVLGGPGPPSKYEPAFKAYIVMYFVNIL